VSTFYVGAAALIVALYALGIGDVPGSLLPEITAWVMGGTGIVP
jgi:hypothetical protein